MKSFFPLIFALLVAACSDTSPSSAPDANADTLNGVADVRDDAAPDDTSERSDAEPDATVESGQTDASEDGAVDAADGAAVDVTDAETDVSEDATDADLSADIAADVAQDALADDAGDAVTADSGVDADVNDIVPPEDANADTTDTGTVVCPGAGAEGTRPGMVLPNLTLTTCDGEVVSTHDLCGNEASAIVGFADWCPSCRAKAPRLQSLYESIAREGVEIWFVVTQTTGFTGADARLCAEVRDRYGLTMPVFYDPSASFRIASGIPANDASIVLGSALDVVSNAQYRSAALIEADLRSTLAP